MRPPDYKNRQRKSQCTLLRGAFRRDVAPILNRALLRGAFRRDVCYMTRACALDLRTVLRTGRAGWGRGSIIHLGRGRAFGVYFTLWRCKFLRVLCLDQRQPNGKCAALSHSCAGHFNLSIVGLDKRLCDGQPQPNAAAVSCSIFVDPVEAVKNT